MRSFVENHDGSFDIYVPKAVDVEATSQTDHCLPVLKPLELRTFLKIGMVTRYYFFICTLLHDCFFFPLI